MQSLSLVRMIGVVIFLGTQSSCVTSTNANREQNGLFEQGNELAKDGLLREASQSYRKLLKQQPNHVKARRNLGIVQIKLRNYAAGVRNLELIANKFETDFTTNFWLAEGLRSVERNADAIFRLRRLSKQNLMNCALQKHWRGVIIKFATTVRRLALQKIS